MYMGYNIKYLCGICYFLGITLFFAVLPIALGISYSVQGARLVVREISPNGAVLLASGAVLFFGCLKFHLWIFKNLSCRPNKLCAPCLKRSVQPTSTTLLNGTLVHHILSSCRSFKALYPSLINFTRSLCQLSLFKSLFQTLNADLTQFVGLGLPSAV